MNGPETLTKKMADVCCMLLYDTLPNSPSISMSDGVTIAYAAKSQLITAQKHDWGWVTNLNQTFAVDQKGFMLE